MKETLIGGTADNIREDCITDAEAVYEYLSNMSTVAWFNYGQFRHNVFEKEKRIIKRSTVIKYKTKEKESIWKRVNVHLTTIQDEIDLVQWGLQD